MTVTQLDDNSADSNPNHSTLAQTQTHISPVTNRQRPNHVRHSSKFNPHSQHRHRHSSWGSASSFDSTTSTFRSPLLALPSPALDVLPLPLAQQPSNSALPDVFSLSGTSPSGQPDDLRTLGFFSNSSRPVLPPPRLSQTDRPPSNLFDSPDSSPTPTPSNSPPALHPHHLSASVKPSKPKPTLPDPPNEAPQLLASVASDSCNLSIKLHSVSPLDLDSHQPHIPHGSSPELSQLHLGPPSRHPTLVAPPSRSISSPPAPSSPTIAMRSAVPPIEEPQGTLLDPLTGTLYHLTRTLGSGSFSKVVEARSPAGSLVALKMIANSAVDANARMKSSVGREIGVLQHIRHPLLVSLLAAFETTDSKHTVLVLERVAGGELFDLVARAHSFFTSAFLTRALAELCTVVGWMHKLGLVHRDIKLENILLTWPLYESSDDTGFPPETEPMLKLTDFGLSRFIDLSSPLLTTRCGSEEYAAPELILGKQYDGRRTDVWALGVVGYTLLVGRLPFEGPTQRSMMVRIAKGSYSWPSKEVADEGESEVRKMVEQMLVRDPEKRVKLEEGHFALPVWTDGVGEGRRPVEGSEAARFLAGETLPDH